MTEIASEPENMQAVSKRIEEDVFRSDFNLVRELPEDLAKLDRISKNFAWSWLPGGIALFRDIDAGLWKECEQNPRTLLNRVSDLRLQQLATEAAYIARLRDFEARFDRYMAPSTKVFGEASSEHPIAYFCAEFGVHTSLPIYSGGLGILAGDHLKSASDLGVPLIAVGLMYRYGYFRQRIGHDGWQNELYLDSFAGDLALSPVTDDHGNAVKVSVHIRGREVWAKAWLAEVGRVPLYLLDTHLPENDQEEDRLITGHLYGGSTETRIVQEKMLGIGGVRLLQKLNISPSVFHLNEGHSAFLTLELARDYLAAFPEASFEDARKAIRQECVFTTHTPVAAGNDLFSPDELAGCFDAEYINELRLSKDEFFDLGRIDPADDTEFFGMTPLALRMTRNANGVSKKHGEVSRELWAKLFKNTSTPEAVPITHITNGVHFPTWIAPPFQSLFESRFGNDWHALTADADKWKEAVDKLADEEIWDAHLSLKKLMIAFIRFRIESKDVGTHETINEHIDTKQLLSPEVLTIGFARRVAAYKRWNLLLTDIERLLRIVDDRERPVQFVFAGKAHPQDKTAKQILQQLMSINNESNWQNRAVFIEDYDQEVARYLVQGVDVWMNVPRRPMEASGTSGMKAAMNGVLNMSILDGWWIEGFNGENGFAVGSENENEEDAKDAEALYAILEQDVVPAFYNDRADAVSPSWIKMMRSAIATITPQFSTHRMLLDYVQKIYSPER